MSHVGKTITSDGLALLRSDVHDRHILGRRFGHEQVFMWQGGFDFAAQIRRLLVAKGIVDDESDLSLLHRKLQPSQMALGDDELNAVSRAFYETDDEFMALYHAFVEQVGHELSCAVYYQATPTFRFHFPCEEGFNWYPRYHSDIMLGHPPAEVNVWVPITDAFDSNTMRLASYSTSLMLFESCGFDFARFAAAVQDNPMLRSICDHVSVPVQLNPGLMLLFNPLCIHATQYNATDHTRVSMDCRVIPVNCYNRLRQRYVGTGRRQMAFAPGGYYEGTAI